MARTDTRVRHNPTSSRWFRSDINGLRVLAIVPVVAHHAGIPGFSGGFIGVDVFFVISGFLITSNLLREVDLTGRLQVASFWARRIRRLLPASLVVTVVTFAVALWVFSPLQWAQLGKETASALFYVSNVLFARQETDYFAADLNAPSPFLHMWSLGVEEQFYLLWPVGIVFGGMIARRMGVPIRRVLHVAFAATIMISFSLSLIWTMAEPQMAFYLLPARAWEFAAGALIALIPVSFRVSAILRSAMVLLGVAGLVGATLLFSPSIPYPGLAALVPVLATILIIVGGREETATWPSRALAARPMQWIGDHSYSWYLWHWPFIVLAASVMRTESTVVKVLAGIFALMAAIVTHRYIENPIRFSDRFALPPRRVFFSAAATTLAVAIIAGGAFAQGSAVLDRNRMFEDAIVQVPDQECDRWSEAPNGSPICEMGDLDSKMTVVLVGDSHAGQWKNALGAAAKAESVRLIVRWKSSCPGIGVDTVNSRGEWDPSCRPYQRKTMEIIDQVKPDAVLLAQAEAYEGRIADSSGKVLPTADGVALWRKNYARTVTALQGSSGNVGVILDNPRMDYDPNSCLIESDDRSTDCRPTRDSALSAISTLQAKSLEVVSKFAVYPVLDTVGLLCGAKHCEVMDGGVPVYRDYNHLSEKWTMTQMAELTNLLNELRSA